MFFGKDDTEVPPPRRSSLNEWYKINRAREKTFFDLQNLAGNIVEECDRVRDKVNELTEKNKKEVEHDLSQRLEDIEFNKTELLRERKAVCLEIDNLQSCIPRILKTMSHIKDNALPIPERCVGLRENRLGIDLCHDHVESELLKEIKMIEEAHHLMNKVHEKATEQVRLCRASLYHIDRDLKNKDGVLNIEQTNTSLRHHSLNLIDNYRRFPPLDAAEITPEEWDVFTRRNVERAAKEIGDSMKLRSYVENILNQIFKDLTRQREIVNECFLWRIDETKQAKRNLEKQHGDITKQSNEVCHTIRKLEDLVQEKDANIALVHTRLANRAKRSGMELCRDTVEIQLENEVRKLRGNLGLAQHMLAETRATLRHLMKSQVQLEQDINVKTNTIKIDEIDCMMLRQSLEYYKF